MTTKERNFKILVVDWNYSIHDSHVKNRIIIILHTNLIQTSYRIGFRFKRKKRKLPKKSCFTPYCHIVHFISISFHWYEMKAEEVSFPNTQFCQPKRLAAVIPELVCLPMISILWSSSPFYSSFLSSFRGPRGILVYCASH